MPPPAIAFNVKCIGVQQQGAASYIFIFQDIASPQVLNLLSTNASAWSVGQTYHITITIV